MVNLVLGIVLVSGCIGEDLLSQFTGDPVVRRADPYISKIVFEDITLRKQAASIVSDCPSGDKECQINSIYRYIVENYSYYSDPRREEFIQSPYDTLDVRGGDCEDLTILLISMLENLGINTYFVITEDHAYALACDVDVGNLQEYIETPILEQISRDLVESGQANVVMEEGSLYIMEQKKMTFTMKPGYLYYYGGNGSDFDSPIEKMNIQYDLSSSQPLNVYVVPSKNDYELMSRGRMFKQYTQCKNQDVIWITDRCDGLSSYGGVILQNDNQNEAIVDLDMRFYFSYSSRSLLEDQRVSYYEINNKTCIVLDATAGRYGYPGFDANPEGEKIAIDPLTKEYMYLE